MRGWARCSIQKTRPECWLSLGKLSTNSLPRLFEDTCVSKLRSRLRQSRGSFTTMFVQRGQTFARKHKRKESLHFGGCNSHNRCSCAFLSPHSFSSPSFGRPRESLVQTCICVNINLIPFSTCTHALATWTTFSRYLAHFSSPLSITPTNFTPVAIITQPSTIFFPFPPCSVLISPNPSPPCLFCRNRLVSHSTSCCYAVL